MNAYLDYKGLGSLVRHIKQSNSSTIKPTTSMLIGLGTPASVDDALQALANYAISDAKLAHITVRDEDGNALPNVILTGVMLPDGTAAITDENGSVLVSIPSKTNVNFSVDYIDIPSISIEIEPSPDKIVNSYSVIMPYIEANSVREITTSGLYSVHNQHNALICCAGGGNDGSRGNDAYNSSGAYTTGGDGGSGGTGGKIYNENYVLTASAAYECVIASSAGETTFDNISSVNGTSDTLALLDESYRNKIGGSGGNGGKGGGCYVSNDGYATLTTPSNGANSDSAGGGGGGGGGCSHSNDARTGAYGGSSTYGSAGNRGSNVASSNYGANGGKGGDGGYAGGGGGGGGGGGALSTASTAKGSGGPGGKGGQGIVLIKFLD